MYATYFLEGRGPAPHSTRPSPARRCPHSAVHNPRAAATAHLFSRGYLASARERGASRCDRRPRRPCGMLRLDRAAACQQHSGGFWQIWLLLFFLCSRPRRTSAAPAPTREKISHDRLPSVADRARGRSRATRQKRWDRTAERGRLRRGARVHRGTKERGLGYGGKREWMSPRPPAATATPRLP